MALVRDRGKSDSGRHGRGSIGASAVGFENSEPPGCYRRDYLRTTVAMPARIFGDDFSLGDGLEDGSAHQ